MTNAVPVNGFRLEGIVYKTAFLYEATKYDRILSIINGSCQDDLQVLVDKAVEFQRKQKQQQQETALSKKEAKKQSKKKTKEKTDAQQADNLEDRALIEL